MKLLSPLEVKNVKDSISESQAKTIADLGARIVDRTRELNIVSGQVELMRKMAQEEGEEIRIQIETLNNALGSLRQEREDLMAPIKETKEEWRVKVQEVEARIAEVEEDKRNTEDERNRYLQYIEQLEDREDELTRYKEELERRERGVKKEEEVAAATLKSLEARISETTEKINTANASFAAKEAVLTQREHALKVRTEALDAEQSKFWEDSRAERRKLDDMRKTLERALISKK
jgi:chromosome segregation ATPase